MREGGEKDSDERPPWNGGVLMRHDDGSVGVGMMMVGNEGLTSLYGRLLDKTAKVR